ncbi:MAG: YfhO family protein [Cytophagales bacterium]|nr:YfhO family protein [Cytophagales bacterium]
MNIKPYLHHIYIIIAFAIIVMIYFSPLIFQGKKINQHDIVQFQGMVKEISDLREKYHEEPYWTNAMFGGMPNTLINMNQWGNLIKPVHDFMARVLAYPASLVFIGLLCYYVMLLAFDIHFIAALAGALGFAFSTFTMVSLVAGHNAKVACMMYMPLVLAGMVLAYRKNIGLGAAIFGIGVALQIVNNHIQITYYLIFAGLLYFGAEFIQAYKNKTITTFAKATGALAIAALLGFGTHAGYFLSIEEYSKYTIRGKTELAPLAESKEVVREDGLDRDYVFNYSYSIDEPFTFLIADYYGGVSGAYPENFKNTAKVMRQQGYDPNQILRSLPSYFGNQPFVAGPMYMGAIVVFLFILGLIVVKHPIKWALLAATIIGILLSYGKNFPSLNYFLFDYFPLYNKFRSVAMAVVIPQICLSLLGILALQELIISNNKKNYIRPLQIAGAVVLGILALVYILAGSANYLTEHEIAAQFPDWLSGAIADDRKSMRTTDTLRSALFILSAIVILYFYLKDKLKTNVALGAVAALVLVDLWSVDKRYLNDNNFEKKLIETFYAPNSADLAILQDRDPNFRVLNLDNTFNESRTSYFHKSIGGYSPAKLRRYQDLIERALAPQIQDLITNLKNGSTDFSKVPVINMLNTKYILAGEDEGAVIPNQYALGNAWFVSKVYSVASADTEIASLNSFDPSDLAVADTSKFKISKDKYIKDSTAQITLTNYKPYDLTYISKNNNEGLAVFSEVYYPKGWTATIDDKDVEIKRVNYVLRALEVPAGNHTIRFVMKNEKHIIGNTIGLVSSFVLIAGVLAIVFVQYKSLYGSVQKPKS